MHPVHALLQIVGPSAVDEVVLSMLDDFSTNDNHDALSGLCLVVAKGRGLLASLMPRITKPPINSTALCQLAAANPDSLSRNLSKILEALLCPVENLGCSLAKVCTAFCWFAGVDNTGRQSHGTTSFYF